MDKALSPTQTPDAARAGEWPLAVESGDAARVQSLLASGAGVDATFDRGETALMRASARGYADVARVLLAAGADVNARRDDGFTPLILAVFFGQEDVVRLLLEAGADTSARTALGTTAAKWAASRGFKEIVELLREVEASHPPRAQEPEERPRAATGEARPAVTSAFELQELPSAPPDPSDARRASTVGHEDSNRRTDEHQDLKTKMEAIVAASSASTAREPGAADIREGTSFINNEAVEGATVESPRSEEFKTPTPFAPDESASKTTRKDSPAPSGSRFRSVLQSWPVTAGALVLIVASVASVFLLQGSSETSGTRPATTAGEAPQPVVPQTPSQAAETLPQPSPSVTPEVAQPLPAAPGTYDSFPFTTSPQEVTVSSGASTTGTAPASNVPSVVSESDIGGGGRTTEGEETRGRATPRETRGASPASADAPREAREGEGVDEGAARETPPRNPPPRTGVETRRTTAGAPPPSNGNTPPPAPTPAERRKVIPWP